MKRNLVFSLFLALGIGTTAFAQIQRGNVMVGGDIANLDLNLDGGGNFSAQLDPKIAWFIKDNFAVGGYLSFGLATAKHAGTNINYGIGALTRYYISDPKINPLRHSRFFAEGNIGIEGYNPAVGGNTNGLGVGIGPGIAYFITPNIGLEGLLKYNGIVGFGSRPATNNLNFSLGFQIYLSNQRLLTVKEELRNN